MSSESISSESSGMTADGITMRRGRDWEALALLVRPDNGVWSLSLSLIQAVEHRLRIPSAVPFLATGKIVGAGALELDHHPQNLG